jgi:hypothetical protein
MFNIVIVVCSLLSVPDSHDCKLANSVKSLPVGNAPLVGCMMQGQATASQMLANGDLELEEKEYIVIKCIGGPRERAA